MITVYGQPALEVPQPDGEIVGYLWRAVPAGRDARGREEWRAWIVTSPKGAEYRVSEFADGGCHCTCSAFKFNRHGAGKWLDVNGTPVCKHCFAIYRDVIEPAAEGRA